MIAALLSNGVTDRVGTAISHLALTPAAATTPTTSTSPQCGGLRVQSLCTANGSLHIPVAYRSILPVLILSIGALLLLLVSALLSKRSRPGLYPLLTVVIGGAAAVASAWQWSDVGTKHAQATIGQQIFYDRFSVFFMLLISIAVVLGALISDSYLRREGLDGVEAYVLMLLAGTGAMLMAESAGLIMLFLGLEIMSIALYVMAAYHRRRTQSGEAGFKYFILGAFSSAIFLYGIALVYGATGSTQFDEIAAYLARNTLPNNGVLLAGIALILVGLGFKVGAVPFHFWIPDVYEGSPTPFTGYMASVAKAAGFAGLLRVVNEAFSTQQANWRPAIWLMAVLTLLVGSVLAIAQRDLKRMLAYSSISQAGYVLVGVQAASSNGTAGALYYLFTYTFIIAGTFAVVGLIQGPGEARNDLGAVRGLARRRPVLALAMLVFLLAQAGVPFTSGFLAKFYVISAAVQRGQYVLAIIAMLAAAIAAFFYLRVALLMYSEAPAVAGNVTTPEDAIAGGGAISAEGQIPGGGAMAREGAMAGTRSAASHDAILGQLADVEDNAVMAGLEPVVSLDGRAATATLEAPSEQRIVIPFFVGLALTICVVFTIAAGVSSPLITFARDATTIF